MAISEKLQRQLWSFVKARRDALHQAIHGYEEARELLQAMQDERLDSHLPTLDEVIAAGPYERRE